MMRLCVLALALLTSSSLRAEDWPEFRGPTGQGIVRKGGLPTEWGPQKNVVWKKAIPGKGWSSPVVVSNRVYLTTAVPNQGGLSLRALCLEAGSGRTVWDREIFHPKRAPGIHSKNSHASPTPLVHDGKLFVHFGNQGTACLNLDGTILWKTVQRYAPVHGSGGTPILVDGLLVFNCDGGDRAYVVALNASNGKERWRAPRKGNAAKKFSFSTPLLIDVKGQKQIVSAGSDEVSGFNPRDGKEIWRVHFKGYSLIPRPVYGHGLVFLSTSYDSPTFLAIRPDGEGDVTKTHIAWRLRRGAPHTPSPLLVGDELYLVSDGGIASCVNAKTGKPYWQERIGGAYSASPVYADGKVYFQSEAGVGTVVRAGKDFEKLATNDMGEPTLASYAAADGALFLRTAEHLYRIESR